MEDLPLPHAAADRAAQPVVVPRPAATVVLLRPTPGGPPEVLLTLRPASMAFAADLHVFPGGRVDAGDADPRLAARASLSADEAAERLGGAIEPAAALAAHVAAIRELFEEAGVLLADTPAGADRLAAARTALLAGRASFADIAAELDLVLRCDRLAPLGHWTTPPVMPRRFDTRFFAAELPEGVEATFEGGEVVGHRWLTARAALDAMAAGSIGMWIPTSATLQQLEHVRDLDEVRRRLAPGPAAAPRVIVERPGLVRIVLSGAGAVGGQAVNAYLVGRRELVVIDPGDPSDAAADALLAAAEAAGGRVVAVALTHVDPDHAAGAEVLALRFDLPILAAPGAGRDLPYDVREAADGERLPGDGGATVVATPGPRPDHLAFALDSGGIIVGDLVGGRGSRAVVGPGDGVAWRASLDRVAGLRPSVVYPGHGEPRPGQSVGE